MIHKLLHRLSKEALPTAPPFRYEQSKVQFLLRSLQYSRRVNTDSITHRYKAKSENNQFPNRNIKRVSGLGLGTKPDNPRPRENSNSPRHPERYRLVRSLLQPETDF